MTRLIMFALLFAFLIPTVVSAEDQIGVIKTAKGEVIIVRNGANLPGSVGEVLFQGDILKTAVDSSAGIVMNDDTTVSLGSESELSFNEYLFNPKEDVFSVALRFVKGTFAYVSGVIGKLSPESIRLETPDSTIAVRGTRILIKVDN